MCMFYIVYIYIPTLYIPLVFSEGPFLLSASLSNKLRVLRVFFTFIEPLWLSASISLLLDILVVCSCQATTKLATNEVPTWVEREESCQ